MTLSLSLIALVLGPFLFTLGQHRPLAKQMLDGFIFVTIAGIVCVHIVPETVEVSGAYAVLFLILGLVFPVVIERFFHRSLRQAHAFILLLAALGLVLHATIDGIALLPLNSSMGHAEDRGGLISELFGNQLALGVILHRLPVGMAIWWSVRTSFGVLAAVAAFLLITLATTAAYFLGQPVVELAETPAVLVFQSFVAGSLLHVVTFGVSHDHGDDPQPARAVGAWGYRVGVLIGMFFIGTAPQFFT